MVLLQRELNPIYKRLPQLQRVRGLVSNVPPGACAAFGVPAFHEIFPLLYLDDDYEPILSGCVLGWN